MKRILVITICTMCILTSCEKYLDIKPDKKLAVPATLQDAVALLDYTFLNTYSGLSEAAADNYYMTAADWATLSVRDRNIYVWQNDEFDGDGAVWAGRYHIIFAANEVLGFMKKFTPAETERIEYNRVNGSSLFFRAYAMQDLLQHFSKPYDKATAGNDPGVSIRLSPDVNEKTTRSSVQKCYDQVLIDLKQAIRLLPSSTSIPTRPGKAAAYAALANVCLTTEDYQNAALYADSALQLNKELIDYSTLNSTAAVPFARHNKETIFYATGGSGHFATSRLKIDSTLYKSYHTDDLRKSLFFQQNVDKSFAFKGNYNGQNSSILFIGLTTAEMLLVRAESYARTGKLTEALKDLNLLMVNRWKKGSYVAYSTSNTDQALEKILQERRKELVLRGRRWSDLRRLNRDARFAITLKRQINADSYQLPSNDKRYVFPIPEEIIQLTGIAQNER